MLGPFYLFSKIFGYQFTREFVHTALPCIARRLLRPESFTLKGTYWETSNHPAIFTSSPAVASNWLRYISA